MKMKMKLPLSFCVSMSVSMSDIFFPFRHFESERKKESERKETVAEALEL